MHWSDTLIAALLVNACGWVVHYLENLKQTKILKAQADTLKRIEEDCKAYLSIG